jgi:hypothetical protein
MRFAVMPAGTSTTGAYGKTLPLATGGVVMDDPFRRPALTAGVFYKGSWAARI